MRAVTNMVEIPEGKQALWRPVNKWEDNIKVGPKETGYDEVDVF
jgi:hypothetical protein